MHCPKNKWLRSCGSLSPGLLQLELNQKGVTINQSQSHIHFPALEKDTLNFSCFWASVAPLFFQVLSVALLTELAGWNSKPNTSSPGLFPLVILKQPPCPPLPPNLLRTVLGVKAGFYSISWVLSTSFTLSCDRYVCETESGVMCLDFHPEHPNFIAAGFYDGMW